MAESPLAEGLAALASYFVGAGTLEETLGRVADLTVEAVAPADFAGLTMPVEGRQRTAVFTDRDAPEVDQAQYDTGDGPCLDSLRHAQVYSIDSTAEDGPWPAFRQACASRGIRSTLSMPLVVDHGTVGAMNLYSRTDHAFAPGDRDTAVQFAAQAAIVLANSQAYWDAHELSARLGEAMKSRATIEQAKGILMGAQRCGPDEAFDLLTRASQRENVKLREIARRIVERAAGEPAVRSPAQPASTGPASDGPGHGG
jgi:GAF domain-containing protein